MERMTAREQRLARLLAVRVAMNAGDMSVPNNRRIAEHLIGECVLTDDEITKAEDDLLARLDRRERSHGDYKRAQQAKADAA
ncbi:MAG: hypothetical protein ABJI96_08030 [Paracoccaceae bacterium]